MTLVIVDPPRCSYCPMYATLAAQKWAACTAENRELPYGGSSCPAPDWCPLRKGDVVVRFKDERCECNERMRESEIRIAVCLASKGKSCPVCQKK